MTGPYLLDHQVDRSQTLRAVVPRVVDNGGDSVEGDVLCGADQLQCLLSRDIPKV